MRFIMFASRTVMTFRLVPEWGGKAIFSAKVFMAIICSFFLLLCPFSASQRFPHFVPCYSFAASHAAWRRSPLKPKATRSQKKSPSSDFRRDNTFAKAFQGDGRTVPEWPVVLRHGQDTWP